MKAVWSGGTTHGDIMRMVMELHGEVQLNRRFLRWSGYAGDATPVWESIYDFLREVEKGQFASEGVESGHAWAQLAISTVEAKHRLGLHPEILRATDALYKSLTGKDDSNQLKIIQPQMLAFGSMLDYAKFHQSGTTHMVQRRPIDLSQHNKDVIVKAVQMWLARGVVIKGDLSKLKI
jgi:hypothetical protein